MRASVAHGIHGDGSRDYKATDMQRVIAGLRGAAETGITVEDLARQTGVDGRAVRQLLSDHDGVTFLLSDHPDGGYVLCDFADDGDALTGRLRRQVNTMQERLNRRDDFAQTLPRRQDFLL